MFDTFLIKYGEIGVKGKNRYMFEEALVHQIELALRKIDGKFRCSRESGRIYVYCMDDFDYDETVDALQHVFGIVGICPVLVISGDSLDEMSEACIGFLEKTYDAHDQTFKVNCRRAKKSYPISSMEVNSEIGARILDHFPEMKVDVHEPQIMLHVEIRNRVYIYSKVIPGPGGMPVGTNARAMLLLSGGIDSPVAGWMIAKRGVALDAIYFNAPPYTSERAKQKVIDLAKIVARYSGPIRLHIVNFTDIQLYIYEQCPHDELTIIMRRYMMIIAEHFAKEAGDYALVTGESIGQVASQTIQSLFVTNEVCTMPVFRPLIGFDKQDIVDISEKIKAYDTSILPYEDCCTIFVARHPVTKPNLKSIKKSEVNLQEKIDQLLEQAYDSVEIMEID